MNNLYVKFIKSLKSNYLYYLLFAVVNIWFFSAVLSSHGVLYFNDYAPSSSLQGINGYLSHFGIYNLNDNSGYFRSNFLNEIAPLVFLKLLSLLFNYELCTKLFYVLGFLIINILYFHIFKKISADSLISFLLSLLVTLNLWNIDRIQQGHYFNLMFFLPLFGLYCYYLFFSKNNNRYIVLSIILIFSISTYYHYTFILFYILFIDFIVQLILKIKMRELIRNYFTMLFLLLSMSSVFVLPYLFNITTFTTLNKSVSTSNSLDVFSWQSTILSTLFHIRTGMASFQLLDGLIYPAFLLGMLGILFFIFYPSKKDKYDSKTLRITTIVLILFILSFGYKISKDLFINVIYKIPFMSVFRDMNKFTGVAFILTLFLLSIRSQFINKKGRFLIILSAVFTITPSLIAPYGFFNNLLQENFVIIDDNSLHSIVSFPSFSMAYIRHNGWGYHNYIPILNGLNGATKISIPYDYQQDDMSIERYAFFKKLYTDWTNLSEEEVYSLLADYNIKYIYYYKDFQFKSNIPLMDQWYKQINIAEKLKKNTPIANTSLLTVYQIPNEYLKSFMTSDGNQTSLFFKKENDEKFRVFITTKSLFNLTVLTNYNTNWQLYLAKNPTNSWCKPLAFFDKTNTTECIHSSKSIVGDELSYFINKPIFDSSHKMVNDFANGWTIDPEYIKRYYPQEYYKQNPDGSISIELILYFKPQSYFYLGLLITCITIMSCLAYLSYYEFRREIQINKQQ